MKFTLRDTRFGSFLQQTFARLFPGLQTMQQSSWYNLSSRETKWLAHGNLWALYTGIPHLTSVINTRAELFSQGRVRLRKIEDGSEVFKHKVLTLLNKPNPLQTKSEFMTMFLTFKDIYSNVPILMNGVMSSQPIPGQLWNLPPACFKVKTTGQIFKQVQISDIISGYELEIGGTTQSFTPEEIIFINDNLGQDYLISESKLISLIKPLSNIDASLRTANIVINEGGPSGIISAGGKDASGGIIPLGAPEQNRIEGAFKNKYGHRYDQIQTVVSTATLTYTPIGSPLTDMLLSEEIEQDFGIIIAAYFLDRDLFPGTQGATFENKKQARIGVIQNTIQSEADDFANRLNVQFKLFEEGLELFITYDHLPIMQQDEQARQTADKIKAEKLSILLKDGIIDRDYYAIVMGVELGKEGANKSVDNLGKIPLAIQQLALARERANTAGDIQLSDAIREAMDTLTRNLVESVLNTPTNGNNQGNA
jgi:hypothetical protein